MRSPVSSEGSAANASSPIAARRRRNRGQAARFETVWSVRATSANQWRASPGTHPRQFLVRAARVILRRQNAKAEVGHVRIRQRGRGLELTRARRIHCWQPAATALFCVVKVDVLLDDDVVIQHD